MKKMKTILVVMLCLCTMLVVSGMNKLTVEAEGATTYTLKVVDDEWRFQPNYPWVDGGYHRELYYMYQELKEGDKIVVSDSSKGLELNVDKKLSNVTVEHGMNVLLFAPGIEEFYILNNSIAVVNSDVNKAYVYEASVVNFNNNVNYLEINAKYPLKATVGSMGTVGHVKAQDQDRVHYEFYNFAAGKLSIKDGSLTTDKAHYSEQPVAASTPVVNITTNTNASASDELDDVPKTGDVVNYYWMLGVAAVCMAGGLYFKKKNV